jgi:HlyD family secretion protein
MPSPPTEDNPQTSPSKGEAQQGGGSRWSRLKNRPVAILLVTFLVVIFVGLTALLKQHQPRSLQPSASAAINPVQAPRLKGTTQAVETRAILAPLLSVETESTLTIVKLTPAGTHVKRGDILVEFDRQAQLRDFITKQAAQSDLSEKVLEAQQKEVSDRAKDETERKEAEDSLAKAQLEIQKIEILSRIDAEKAQENLEEAKATVAQLRETFDLKRKAAQASIRVLEIQRDRNRQTMLHAEANANLMQVHSPIDGIVVLNTIWKQGNMGEVQEGDQVRAGVPFMQVVDPSKMEVQVPINQEDLQTLKVGEAATVHLDAYPALAFSGHLENIDPIGRSGDFSGKVRTFAAIFSITGHDPRLMPDLSAAIDLNPSAYAANAGGSQ